MRMFAVIPVLIPVPIPMLPVLIPVPIPVALRMPLFAVFVSSGSFTMFVN